MADGPIPVSVPPRLYRLCAACWWSLQGSTVLSLFHKPSVTLSVSLQPFVSPLVSLQPSVCPTLCLAAFRSRWLPVGCFALCCAFRRSPLRALLSRSPVWRVSYPRHGQPIALPLSTGGRPRAALPPSLRTSATLSAAIVLSPLGGFGRTVIHPYSPYRAILAYELLRVIAAYMNNNRE